MRKQVDQLDGAKMRIIIRHGEALLLLEKFTRSFWVKWLCPKLHREAVIKIDER